MTETLRYWLKGIRFYIALGSALVTGLTIWWAQAAYGGSQLATIRTQETFAWLATGLIALALSIGPTLKLFPRFPGRQLWFDARRLIGVSAAWFATLHVSTAYISQFKLANPFNLPNNYRWAFGIGAIALIILLAMAFTSFDKAFKGMGVWWFRLHRLIYLAAICILLHIFMIGVHASELGVVIALCIVSGLLLVSHIVVTIKSGHWSVWRLVTTTATLVALVLTLHYGFSQRAHTDAAGRELTQAHS